jgi:hypothetical protein
VIADGRRASFAALAAAAIAAALSVRSAAAYPFVWEPTGIPFAGEGALPLFGGIGSGDLGARFRLADLDDDGDLDLYLLDKDGRLATYRNDGISTSARFVPADEDLLGRPLFDWFLFADVDADDDPDLLGGVGPSDEAIALFRNTGARGSPAFSYEPSPPFLDSVQVIPRLGNMPAFVDLDGDSDLDVFYVMPDQGIGAFHENVGTAAAPLFASQTLDYGGLNTFFGKRSGAPEDLAARHGSSLPTFFDIDADLDLDIFIGDLLNPNVWLFRNDGGADSAIFTRVSDASLALPFDTVLVNSIWSDAADVDGDALIDLVVSPGEDYGRLTRSLFVLRNTGAPDSAAFSFSHDTLLCGIDLGVRSYPSFADLDGDGDQDLVLSRLSDEGEPGLVLFENVGSAVAPQFARVVSTSPLDAVVHDSLDTPSPAFADMDGDGDLDLLAGAQGFRRQVFYFENEGSPQSAQFKYRGTLLDPVRQNIRRRPDNLATPTLGDLDGDADLDLLVGEFGTSGRPQIYWYRNVGFQDSKRAVPSFEWVTSNADSAFGFDTVADSVTGSLAPVLVDADRDGRLDLLVGAEDGRLRLYRQCDAEPLSFARSIRGTFAGIDVGRSSAPALVDIDADGDLDLFVGEENGGLNFYRNDPIGGPALSSVTASSSASGVTLRIARPIDSPPADLFVCRGAAEDALSPAMPAVLSDDLETVLFDSAGVFAGNAYVYRVDAVAYGLGAASSGTVTAAVPLPAVALVESSVEEDAAGARVTWRVSAAYRGMAFRLSRRVGGDADVVVAGADSIESGPSAAIVDSAGTRDSTYRLELLYRRVTAGASFVAVADSIFAPALISRSVSVPFRAHPARPNPAGSSAAVRFVIDLPGDGPVRLTLFDAAGRRIRFIESIRLAAGPGRVIEWDGTSDDGDPAPSGAYLYRLEAAGHAATGRITRVR